MGRELGRRIVGHVTEEVRKAGYDLLLEREHVNPAGEPSWWYQVTKPGGMVPFAGLHLHAGASHVSAEVTPLPVTPGEKAGYWLLSPGKTPTREEYAYTAVLGWVPTPEALAEAALDMVRRAEAGELK